jgi:hypothetical protein
MTNKDTPKAWLPAESFTDEARQRYIACFADLVATQAAFTVQFYRWTGEDYVTAASARITQTFGASSATEIELQASKRYQGVAKVPELEARSYKRAHPTSAIWTKAMRGKPTPSMVSNHLFAGVVHLVDFKTDMGFVVRSESNQAQDLLNKVLAKHNVWGMPTTGDLRFLNT